MGLPLRLPQTSPEYWGPGVSAKSIPYYLTGIFCRVSRGKSQDLAVSHDFSERRGSAYLPMYALDLSACLPSPGAQVPFGQMVELGSGQRLRCVCGWAFTLWSQCLCKPELKSLLSTMKTILAAYSQNQSGKRTSSGQWQWLERGLSVGGCLSCVFSHGAYWFGHNMLSDEQMQPLGPSK